MESRDRKEERYTIGEFSKLTGISKDTLRFYDKIGVLCPKFIGESSRYRYYTFDQFWYADMAICLQRLNVPLQDIADVFARKQDSEIVKLLRENRENALRMSEYFMRLADDIEWYARQQRVLEECISDDPEEDDEAGVHLEYFTQRDVMFFRAEDGENGYAEGILPENIPDCHEELKHTDSVKRVRGFVLEPEALTSNELLVAGAYIDIGMSTFDFVGEDNYFTIPAGEYACMVTEVIDGLADFEPLLTWLKEHGRSAELLIADDLGLQFFSGKPDAYLCEVKALVRATR